MSASLTHFLIEVGENPHKMIELRRNPEEILRAAGLPADAADAVLHRDADRITHLLSGEAETLPAIFQITTALEDLHAS